MLAGLTNICKTYLLQVVSPENCLQLRVFAQLYRLDEILQKVDETIAGNFVDVLNRDEIKTLDVDTLTAILSSKKHKVCTIFNVIFVSLKSLQNIVIEFLLLLKNTIVPSPRVNKQQTFVYMRILKCF